jgi:hypothetical protein
VAAERLIVERSTTASTRASNAPPAAGGAFVRATAIAVEADALLRLQAATVEPPLVGPSIAVLEDEVDAPVLVLRRR